MGGSGQRVPGGGGGFQAQTVECCVVCSARLTGRVGPEPVPQQRELATVAHECHCRWMVTSEQPGRRPTTLPERCCKGLCVDFTVTGEKTQYKRIVNPESRCCCSVSDDLSGRSGRISKFMCGPFADRRTPAKQLLLLRRRSPRLEIHARALQAVPQPTAMLGCAQPVAALSGVISSESSTRRETSFRSPAAVYTKCSAA